MKDLLAGIALAFPFIILIFLFVGKKADEIINDAVDSAFKKMEGKKDK